MAVPVTSPRGGLPAERSKSVVRESLDSRSRSPRQPALWHAKPAKHLPEGLWGQYPKGFVAWACRLMRVDQANVLHVCSGALDAGVTVDIRESMQPDIVADGRCLPFPADSFDAVMIDPPYTEEYSRDLYGTDYPRPSHLLAEASRVAKPNGAIGFLHFVVPFPPPECQLEQTIGVTLGCGYRIRAFTVYRKAQPALL